jgi:hypothetical protein
MCDGHMKLCGSKRATKRRIGITINNHDIRPFPENDLLGPSKNKACLPTMLARTHFKVIVRIPNTQFIKKYFRHPVIVMLTRMDENTTQAARR